MGMGLFSVTFLKAMPNTTKDWFCDRQHLNEHKRHESLSLGYGNTFVFISIDKRISSADGGKISGAELFLSQSVHINLDWINK